MPRLQDKDFTPTGLKIEGAWENDRNQNKRDLFKAIIREVYGAQDVIVAHHLAYVAQEERVEDGRQYHYEQVEEIPSADTLIFDHDAARKLWGEAHYLNVLARLAMEPVACRDDVLEQLYKQRHIWQDHSPSEHQGQEIGSTFGQAMWNEDKRVYGGKPNYVHIPDGKRKMVGQDIAQFVDSLMRVLSEGDGSKSKPLCPGCFMIALFNAAVYLADQNGQSRSELGRSMAAAFQALADNPQAGLTEEMAIKLDPQQDSDGPTVAQSVSLALGAPILPTDDDKPHSDGEEWRIG